ncbi:MAG: hypothetical protein WBS24_04425 [Terriglobales bacterium]
MDGLIEIVAASFARYGLDRPGAAARSVDPVAMPAPVMTSMPAEPIALPENVFRRILKGDPAP